MPAGCTRARSCGCRKICRLIIEIVDTEAKIKDFLPILDSMMTSGLVTLEKVQVLQYGEDVKHQPA
jgi:PII-like signaling protein